MHQESLHLSARRCNCWYAFFFFLIFAVCCWLCLYLSGSSIQVGLHTGGRILQVLVLILQLLLLTKFCLWRVPLCFMYVLNSIFWWIQFTIYKIILWYSIFQFPDGTWWDKLWILQWCQYWCRWVGLQAWPYFLWLCEEDFDFIMLTYCIFTYHTYQSNAFFSRMHQLENLVMWTMRSSKVCAELSYVVISSFIVEIGFFGSNWIYLFLEL